VNAIAPPIGLLAELTHRCPLQCPYCSNPVQLDRRSLELDTDTWKRVFTEADELGVLQLHLSGGEPTVRLDLPEIVRHCAGLGLYTNLITSGVLLDDRKLEVLAEAGLDHVQLSLQDVDPVNADQIAGFTGGHEKKLALGKAVAALGLPLTVNTVVHRKNIHSIEATVDLAIAMGARRIEIAHTQYHGWAYLNRAALMPSRDQVMAAIAQVEALRRRHEGKIVIDAVTPDYFARVPKSCMGGWGLRALNVTPSGKVLPCHAAETIPGLAFDNVRQRSLHDIWHFNQAFNAFRGLDWMEGPCVPCERKATCRGGCHCQALAIVGSATVADPVCEKSPVHFMMRDLAEADAVDGRAEFEYRKIGA
jgi:pyrroloquinoline quinone biosynthesis protein E